MEGMLVSGSDDGFVCAWNINQGDSKILTPIILAKDAHQGHVVEDVTWSHFNESEFVSVGDDKCLRLWDLRSAEGCISKSEEQMDDLMCVDTSPFDPCFIATGSNDNQVSLWDQRNLSIPLVKL